MRILGAKFQDRPAALHALEHVRSRFGIDDAAVAPLADGDASAILLATSIDEGRRDEARSVLVDDGGEIVSDIEDELYT